MAASMEGSKNEEYWTKRKKNNEAARRSREKRRMNDLLLERRVLQLTEENKHLKSELLSLKLKHGEIGDFTSPGREAANPLLSPTEDARPSNGDGKQNLQADEDSRSRDSNFTRKLITNATGDTSATVLVNSGGFLRTSERLGLPEFIFNDKQCLCSSSISCAADTSNKTQMCAASKFCTRNSQNNDTEKNASLDLTKMFDMKRLTESSSDFATVTPEKTELIHSTSILSENETFSASRFLQLLRDYYCKVDSQLCFPFPFIPAADFFQKLQLHFRNLQNLAAAATKMGPTNKLGQRLTLCEEENALNQVLLRHTSSDSGFGGSEDDGLTSPPSSPTIPYSFPKKYFVSQPQDMLLPVGNHATKQSPREREVDVSSSATASKTKAEFQLPHKLRLKKSSAKSDETSDPADSSEEMQSPQLSFCNFRSKQCFVNYGEASASDSCDEVNMEQPIAFANSLESFSKLGRDEAQLPVAEKRRRKDSS